MTVRILCVEDNPQNMRLVRKILKSQGYEVLEAEDGFSGLDMAENENPDLILMDVNLPDIDGLEVTRRIKAQPHLNPIPIVALTANAMFGDEERCLAAGCDGYIAKPVSKNKLISNLKSYLESSQTSDTSSESEMSRPADMQALLKLGQEASSNLISTEPTQDDTSNNGVEESKQDTKPAQIIEESVKQAKSPNGFKQVAQETETAKSVEQVAKTEDTIEQTVEDTKQEEDNTAKVEVKKPALTETNNSSQENLPNVSAFRKASRRHQFRKPAAKSDTDSNEKDATSDS